jgi:hypothetical protein
MAENIKISALNELVSGSINGTTVVPVVDGGVTLKAQLSSIKAFTNSDVATDTELANQVSAINNTINALSTDDISEGSNQYYTDARVLAEINSQGVLSGSFPAGYNLNVGSVSGVDTITFTGATVTDNGSGDVDVSIDASALAVDDGSVTVSSVESITFTGATVSAGAAGNVGVSISSGISGITAIDGADVPTSVSNTTTINFEGTTITDEGGGEITIIPDPITTPELNTFTGSIGDRVTTLEEESTNTQLNAFTGSFSSSMEVRVTTLEDASGGGSSVPEGTISSSQQINDLGYISSSRKFISDTITITSSSIDGDITFGIAAGPGGGEGGDVSFNSGYHIISQSIADGSDTNLQLTNIKIGTGINDFKFINFSESLDSRFGSSGGADFINDVSIQHGVITFAGTGNAFSADVPLPNGTISGSTQLTELGVALSGDINEAYIKQRLPDGSVSSSQQLSDFGFATNQSTSSLALKDAITGSFTELSASLSDRIAAAGVGGASGVTEARLGEVTASILNGGARDGEDNPINLISASAQISYPNLSNLPYFIGDGVAITSGSDTESIPYFNLSAGISEYILAHTSSLNYHSASISESVDNLVIASGSISDRLDSVESGTDRIQNLELKSGSIDNSITLLNSFSGSFSSSISQRITNVEGGGGGADYVSNVTLNGVNLEFTGQGSAFNSQVNLSSLSTGGGTEASFGLISQSYDKSTSNLEIGNVVLGGDSGNTTLSTISQSFDTRINAFAGVTELGGLSDVGIITNDVANGDLFLYDSVEQEFTHSKVLNGDYKITGSLDVTGSIISNTISASVITADSFIAGDVGTPTINSANDLELVASNNININGSNSIDLTAGISGLMLSSSKSITVDNLLNISKTIGDNPFSPVTGSIMNSGSIDSDSKLWFYNGSEWKEIAFV